ncbi:MULTISPECIES: hypothetical protein [Bacillus]|uniref:Uncharacterized protein n=1 Tax=Bacillus paranthracis TaxID=2026186 RepID=A0AAJ1K9B4_9BACI|nr:MULTISPECIES: hypothetical protein [Bacillus]MBG9905579.1 hypothetical protein [Bacillus paranthracis]MDG0950322.1 hypothetical protein [Bacillus paranthracis]MDG0956247.1 hypothetical protein [Bacillus paranthracis]QCU08781.1 hypothetical protein BCPR1_02995 [Bacillus paranthracis]TNP23307.1 hypothetical protein FH036_22090 [Bacillus sp. CD3-5]
MFIGFEWLPKRWRERKIVEKFLQAKFVDAGKGILITTYAMDLYVISIPLMEDTYIFSNIMRH